MSLYIVILLLVFNFVAACSPVKLYDEDGLPSSQTALIKGKNVLINGRTWDQTWNSQAKIKAGKQNVLCTGTFFNKAKSCHTSKDFDYMAQSNCEQERIQEIQKYGSAISDCKSCNFDKLSQNCVVPAYYFNCTAKIDFAPMSISEISCARDTDLQSAYDDTLITASMYINGEKVKEAHGTLICQVSGPKDETIIDTCDSCAVVNKCPHR